MAACGAEETALGHDPLDLIEAHLVAPAIGFGRIACNDSPSPQPLLAGGERERRSAGEVSRTPFAGSGVAAGASFVLGLRVPNWQSDGGGDRRSGK